MTEVKKTTTTRKAPAKKPAQTKTVTPIVEETVETVVEKKVETPKVEVKKFRAFNEIQQSELFVVKSMINNPVFYRDKRTGNEYEWINHGDIEHVTYADVLNLKKNTKLINNLILVVEDEELIDVLKLKEKYEEAFVIIDDETILSKSESELRDILNKAPQGVKNTLISKIKLKAEDELETGKFVLLDSIRKMQVIEETLGLDLTLLLDK